MNLAEELLLRGYIFAVLREARRLEQFFRSLCDREQTQSCALRATILPYIALLRSEDAAKSVDHIALTAIDHIAIRRLYLHATAVRP